MIVGVLALQGAFKEHLTTLAKLKVNCLPVKNIHELNSVDALIIPGGESTTIAILAEKSGLFDALKAFIHVEKKPVWGTCAGLILLSEHVSDVSKQAGQKTFGGLNIVIERNAFGKQTDSFIQNITNEVSGMGVPFPAVFIRAPIVAKVVDPSIKVLATAERNGKVFTVAIQKDHLLGTAFHPELTLDNRFHNLFINLVEDSKQRKDLMINKYH